MRLIYDPRRAIIGSTTANALADTAKTTVSCCALAGMRLGRLAAEEASSTRSRASLGVGMRLTGRTIDDAMTNNGGESVLRTTSPSTAVTAGTADTGLSPTTRTGATRCTEGL